MCEYFSMVYKKMISYNELNLQRGLRRFARNTPFL